MSTRSHYSLYSDLSACGRRFFGATILSIIPTTVTEDTVTSCGNCPTAGRTLRLSRATSGSCSTISPAIATFICEVFAFKTRSSLDQNHSFQAAQCALTDGLGVSAQRYRLLSACEDIVAGGRLADDVRYLSGTCVHTFIS